MSTNPAPAAPASTSRASHTPRRRRARSTISLVVVAALALPLLGLTTQVEVLVDGEHHRLRTTAQTVGEVLDELEIDLGPHDAVRPVPSREVTDGLAVTITRAITVEVVLDDARAREVVAPVRSVAGVLEAAGLGDVREQDAEVVPGWTAPVDDGDRITVRLPRNVTIEVDGRTVEHTTLVSDVDAALHDAGIELGEHDLVVPPRDTALDTPLDLVLDTPLDAARTTVTVHRVTYRDVVEEVVLPHDLEQRETDELVRGTTRVAQEGRDGLREDHYRLVEIDGEPAARELIDQVVVAEPVTHLVEVGTASPLASITVPEATWDRLAQCEANGNWHHTSRNGMYYGGLQFHPQTWRSYRLPGYPDSPLQASREQQILVAERVLAAQGWAAWPACSRRLGLR